MSGGITETDPALPTDLDYEEIEAAVLDSERGRWFLAEFAKRNRHAETERLLEAIRRLESSVTSAAGTPQSAQPVEELTGVRAAICEMAEEIAEAKREIAMINGPDTGENDIADATAELDAIVNSAETATSDILTAAEQIQEIAWTLRELEAPADFCDALDERATEIYTACSFQDITGQRTKKVVRVLQLLEARITAMARVWSGGTQAARETAKVKAGPEDDESHLLNGPALDGQGVSQESVDSMFDESGADDDDADAIDFSDEPAPQGAAQREAPEITELADEHDADAASPQPAAEDELCDEAPTSAEPAPQAAASVDETDLSKLSDKDYEALFS